MNIRDKTNRIAQNIRIINELIHIRHHQVAQEHNLSLDQFHLLLHMISKKESPTIGDIAKKSNRAQNTISERITRLEEKGLLIRVKDEKDRRISRVVLTEKGIELIDSINYQARNEFVFNALSRIQEDISTKLLEGLDLLIENLKVEKGDMND